jgi:hypothetical protein
MTIIPQENNTGSDEHVKEYKNTWGIPFGRPGNAVDYAQTIFGVVSVSSSLQLGLSGADIST